MSRPRLAGLGIALLLSSATLEAKPPLETVDMPATKAERAEVYLGYRYDQDQIIRRSIPAALLAVGLSDRDEVTAAVPYLSADGHRGLGDVRLATKYMINYNDKRDSGISAAFEAKLKNGSRADELGTGAIDYQGRLIAQESWKRTKAYINLAQTWVGSPLVNGQRALRHNERLLSAAEETEVAANARSIAEIVWRSSAIPGQPYRLSADTGMRYGIGKNLELHATIGRSLRSGNAGGPELLGYAGFKLAFASMPSDK